MERLSGLARGERVGENDADLQRRALVEVLMHEDRLRLVEALDERRSACAPPRRLLRGARNRQRSGRSDWPSGR